MKISTSKIQREILPYYITMVLLYLNLLFLAILISQYWISDFLSESIIQITVFVSLVSFIIHSALGFSELKYKNWIWNSFVIIISVILLFLQSLSLNNSPDCVWWMWCGLIMVALVAWLFTLIVLSLLSFHISKYLYKNFSTDTIFKIIIIQSFLFLILFILYIFLLPT